MVTNGPRRLLRRGSAEPERPDYSEPDFSSWAAKLDSFVPARTAAVKETATVAETASVEIPVEAPVAETKERPSSLNDVLQKLLAFDGALCVALVDGESGMVLGQAGAGIDMELAAASASLILRARRATIKALGLTDEVDDLLVTLTTQIQIIRPLSSKPTIFMYLIVDKSKASLAMARYKAAEADGQIDL